MAAFHLTAALPAAALALARWRPELQPEPPATAPDPRAVAHEAGHALVAWHCTSVTRVLRVDVTRSSDGQPGGHVLLNRLAWRAPDALWCELAVTLAGMAGELVVFGRVRSLNSADDLAQGLSLARSLAEIGTPPPWSDVPASTLAFGDMFADPIDGAVIGVMRAGYAMARHVIMERSLPFCRLMAALSLGSALGEGELAAALGPRPFSQVIVAVLAATGRYVPARFVLEPQTNRVSYAK